MSLYFCEKALYISVAMRHVAVFTVTHRRTLKTLVVKACIFHVIYAREEAMYMYTCPL